MPTVQIFISYSHQDKTFRDELEINLKPYLRAGSFTSWSDQQIAPGSQWFPEIESALANSKIAVLLVSPDFLASDFIHERELGTLLKKAEEGGVKILWVPVRYSAYEVTPLKNYQAVHDPGNPLAKMTAADRDWAWVTVCEKIEKAVSILDLESRQVEHEKVMAKHEAEIRAIQFALQGIVTKYELEELTFLAKDVPFLCYYSDNLIDELRHLRAIGLIQNQPGMQLGHIVRDYKNKPQQFDLKSYCFITEQGREYLELRVKESF
jgi:hypothetical protein